MRLLALTPLLIGLGLLLYSWSGQAAPPSFSPGGVVCFEEYVAVDYHPDLTIQQGGECDGDPSPGAASDTRTKFCVGYNDDCTVIDTPVTDSNFASATGFLPAPSVIKRSSEYPIGSLSGSLSADTVLGVLGGACNLSLRVNFSLMNASININDVIRPKGIGERDVMLPLAQDANGNGIPDGADKYPAYLNALFDIDHNFGPDGIPNTSVTPTSDDTNGPVPPLVPIARLAGATRIYGGWVILNFLVFEPGVTVLGPGRKPVQLNPDLGYPTAVVLQDATVPVAPGAISDFCGPLRARYVTFGLTHDNPCTGGTDTASSRGNCPNEMDPVGAGPKENFGYPMFPCEGEGTVDDDLDGKINDGCLAFQTAESGAQCDDNLSTEGGGEDAYINDGCPAVGDSEGTYAGVGCSGTNEGGCEARKNPSQSGSLPAIIYTRSLRDADSDGFENPLDTCALRANPEWNPRVFSLGDSDVDGLPNACDPLPNQASPNSPGGCEAGTVGPDQDQDCYSNRQDNCPLTIQLEDPSQPPSYTIPPQGSNNRPQLFDVDGDGIGDACDITTCPINDTPAYTRANCQLFGVSVSGTASDGVASQDGDYATDCLTFIVSVGVGAPPRADGPFHNLDPDCAFFVATPTPSPSPVPTSTPAPCNENADFDCDGVYTAAETPCGSDPLDGTRRPERLDGVFQGRDDDGDNMVDEWLPSGAESYDCDGDGFTGTVESHLYGPNLQGDQDPCGTNNSPPTFPASAAGWPADLKGGGAPSTSNRLNIVDVATFIVPVRYINTNVGSRPGDVRWDLVPGSSVGNDINVADMAALVSGAGGFPPMLGGERAFNSNCPWPP